MIAGKERLPAMLENLSAGGARLVGDLALTRGDSIEVLLEIGGSAIVLQAEVLRVGNDELDDVGIEFRQVPDATQDRIQEFVLATLERQRTSTATAVLVVGTEERIRIALERDLSELGREAISVRTPIEAMWQLQDRARRFDTAIITSEPGAGRALFRYLTERHPEVRRIALSETADETSGVHAVLPKPWHRRSLRNALDRGLADR